MAKLTEESLLNKLLKSRYPLTYYLSRQQEFVKIFSTTQTNNVATPSPESITIMTNQRKAPLPPPSCFNVPDTLDFNASGYAQNDEMVQSSGHEEDSTHEFDETLFLKNNNHRINCNNSDINNEKNLSFIKRSSAIQLEFSPYETNSPLQRAIENGLNIINK